MSRVGITYDIVAEAATALDSTGETVTIEKVRAYIGGTGSNTTISKYLQAWRQQTPYPAADKPVTPDIVQLAVDKVWHDMRAEANSEIARIQTEAEQRIDLAEKKSKATEDLYIELKTAHEMLNQRFLSQSAEKELLQLDLKSLREEYALLQERNAGTELRLADMQKLTNQHYKDLSETHQQELVRLNDAMAAQTKTQTELADALKEQNEKERQNYLVDLDNLKVEVKKAQSVLLKSRDEQQTTLALNKQLEAEIRLITQECTQLAKQLTNHEQKWSYFDDKKIISDEVIHKIYSVPELDKIITAMNKTVSTSLNQQLNEIKDMLRTINITNKKEKKVKDMEYA